MVNLKFEYEIELKMSILTTDHEAKFCAFIAPPPLNLIIQWNGINQIDNLNLFKIVQKCKLTKQSLSVEDIHKYHEQ